MSSNYMKGVIDVRMRLELIIDVVIMFVGIVGNDLAELNSRGCRIYRGNAAQIFVEKAMVWNWIL